MLTDFLATVKEELGLPNAASLTADLHSLLVYEPDQFFLPHQDSEKSDDMVATLVVTLPSSQSCVARRPAGDVAANVVTPAAATRPVDVGGAKGEAGTDGAVLAGPLPPSLGVVADGQLARRFRLALDMYEFGERMELAGLRRRHPDATAEQITRTLSDWRRDRPGAPTGDAAGRPSRRFG